MNRFIKKPMVLLDRYGLVLLLTASFAAFFMAFLEAHQASPLTFLSAFNSIELVFSRSAQERGTWAKVMHLLVSTSMAWAAIRIYLASAGFKWDEFAARYLARDHIVIIGGSSRRGESASRGGRVIVATELALLLSRTHRVVLCATAIGDGILPRLWDAGIIVLKNDFSIAEALLATSTARAQLLIAMREDIGENIALARLALSPRTGSTSLRCMCLTPPAATRSAVQLKDYLEPDTISRVRVFSDAELMARRMVQEFPPDAHVERVDRGAHVLLVGMGSVGQSILLQLARLGHYRSGLKMKVTVVDRHAQARWQALTSLYPALSDWLQVNIEEKIIEDIGSCELDSWLNDEWPICVGYICTKDEVANLRIARLLLNEFSASGDVLESPTPQIVVLDPPGGCLLQDLAGRDEYRAHLKLFNLFEADVGQENVQRIQQFLWDLDDERARRLHEDYCAMDDARCAQDSNTSKGAANQPWDQLPETYREANRASADHFDVKMRAVGRRIISADGAVEAPLTPEELGMLARMEHNRWWADRALDGWRYGEARDNIRKLHPNMVPYDDLTESVRQLDRDNILHIIAILKGESGVLARVPVVH